MNNRNTLWLVSAMLVVMALITTLAAGPAFGWLCFYVLANMAGGIIMSTTISCTVWVDKNATASSPLPTVRTSYPNRMSIRDAISR